LTKYAERPHLMTLVKAGNSLGTLAVGRGRLWIFKTSRTEKTHSGKAGGPSDGGAAGRRLGH